MGERVGRLVGRRAGDKSAAHSLRTVAHSLPFCPHVDEWPKWFFGQGGNCYSVVTLLSPLFPFWTNAECPGEGQSEMLRRMAMDSERVRKQRVPMGQLIG